MSYAGSVYVVIVGGGEIGTQIAEALQHSHDVAVLDLDEVRLKTFDTMDIRFVLGNGADPKDLREAGTHRADAFIACTTNDDINVLACLAAKGLGAKETMALVTRQRYVDAFADHGPMESVGLIIDRVLWPQKLLADQIVDIVRTPRAIDSASFASGRIKLLEYKLEESDPFLAKPLAELRLPPSVLLVGVIRGESFVIPSGSTVLSPGDKIIFMGTTNSMRQLEAQFAPKKRNLNVTIIGGGNVGFMVAEQLQAKAHVTLIEQSEERCEKLAKWLPKVLVLHGDGTDLDLLEQERIEDADALLAVTDDDGKNLLVSLLGKQLGVPKVITRVGHARNRRTFERVGIDTALAPRTVAVQEVLNWLKLDGVDHLASIEDRAEVIEATYPYSRPNMALKDVTLPAQTLVGAILRKQQVIIPTGDTTVQHGDHLFLVTVPEQVETVHRWLEQG